MSPYYVPSAGRKEMVPSRQVKESLMKRPLRKVWAERETNKECGSTWMLALARHPHHPRLRSTKVVAQLCPKEAEGGCGERGACSLQP